MRYYLDTNILVFLKDAPSELSVDVMSILSDYSNTLLASTVCVHEFIHLAQSGKLNHGKQQTTAEDILGWIDVAGIEIVPVSMKHICQYASLQIRGDHKDPNDRLIIAQAISDRIPLISSDHKFDRYSGDGLDFIYNER